jgi:RNA polymerase sigma-70 factor (ECF subfamily)
MNRAPSAMSPSRVPAAAVATVAAAPGSTLSREQFESMTGELADRLLATAMRLTRNRADAEDLVQDTMFRAWRSLATFQPGSLFRAWLFRILRNAFLNKVRHEQMAPDAVDPDTLTPSARAETIPDIQSLTEVRGLSDRHFDDRVKAAVDSLPEVYRVPFLLFTLADMSYEEIAQTLDVPIGTVMSRLHRARAHLRERLEAYAKDLRLAGEGRPPGDSTRTGDAT